MIWQHLVVATDASPTAVHAVDVARRLARRLGARLSIVRVISPPDPSEPASPVRPVPGELQLQGFPGIEIVRFAERTRADLLVLGRHLRGSAGRPRLGPTADAVVRRAAIPVLFVPEGQLELEEFLVALDGTERGFAVYEAGSLLAAALNAQMRGITVEPGAAVGDGAASGPEPSTRSRRLAERLERTGGTVVAAPLEVRHGDAVTGVLGALRANGDDLLVVGAHRGGPGGLPISSGVGRRLLYTAPCAVLTVPL